MNADPAPICNVAGALTAHARARPDAPAVHYPTGVRGGRVRYSTCSYRELDELSEGYARGLKCAGIGHGTRTALMVPPGLDFIALFFGLFRAGAVPVLIDPGIGVKPLRQCLAEAEPAAFIGSRRALLARKLLRWAPTADVCVTAGSGILPGEITTGDLLRLGQNEGGPLPEATRPGEMAAILFTSGSTGVPKGVIYRHRHFTAQVDMLRKAYAIEPGECDLATFPPFALFDPALGMSTVVPWMDPTRPARARPEYLLQAIEQFGVTNVFASPALLKVLSTHTDALGIRLAGVRRIISAGAAVPIATIRAMQRALPDDATVHAGYGATESLPVAGISSQEIDAEIERQTQTGHGICVGRALPPNRIAIIAVSDGAQERMDPSLVMPDGAPGEIAVHGPTTTDAYWRREDQTRLAKMVDDGGHLWHRMGDIGYLAEDGRLWYCGRKSQRVRTPGGTLYPDQVEAIFNVHPQVGRTALVGIGDAGGQKPVLVVETTARAGAAARRRIRAELLRMASAHPDLSGIRAVLFRRTLPVDIRHNAKINREALSAWAARRLR